MKTIRADLHIHTLLSPCGDLEMSPANIIRIAKERKLDMIAITDHNCTKHCRLTQQIGLNVGVSVICGVEVTTKEEVHCLAFFENDSNLSDFQEFIERKILRLPHNPKIFGHQVVIDEHENIIEEIDYMLGSALQSGIDEVQNEVQKLNGIFIPAHIDRPRNSIISQLGFFPPDLRCDAIELSFAVNQFEYLKAHPELNSFSVIRNSDAHFTENIGRKSTLYAMEAASFAELQMALASKDGRKILEQ